jgi:hypothetical protein
MKSKTKEHNRKHLKTVDSAESQMATLPGRPGFFLGGPQTSSKE